MLGFYALAEMSLGERRDDAEAGGGPVGRSTLSLGLSL